MEYFVAFLTAVGAYLIGSINFAIIFSKNIKGVDVRNFGSGNAGATNVLRVAGKKAGILTFLFDMLKGAAAVAFGYFMCRLYLFGANEIFNPVYGAYACGLFCMLGHCWPIFFDFKGGKAAAAGLAIFACCCWPSAVAGAVVFGITLLISRKVSLSSLVATVAVATTSIICGYTDYFYFEGINGTVICVISVLAAILIFYRHKKNIERLISGEEKDISVANE
ncbi:MAG: glycerol-3-phosphate 1-O-acyltransferase PlsY [Clostridiales bacterium]|nr:glycerol-3-phosphate 1-O-acyltransferase PlsY [Candidatus Equinaster intestinalis]